MHWPDARVRLGEKAFGCGEITPLLIFEKEAVF